MLQPSVRDTSGPIHELATRCQSVRLMCRQASSRIHANSPDAIAPQPPPEAAPEPPPIMPGPIVPAPASRVLQPV